MTNDEAILDLQVKIQVLQTKISDLTNLIITQNSTLVSKMNWKQLDTVRQGELEELGARISAIEAHDATS